MQKYSFIDIWQCPICLCWVCHHETLYVSYMLICNMYLPNWRNFNPFIGNIFTIKKPTRLLVAEVKYFISIWRKNGLEWVNYVDTVNLFKVSWYWCFTFKLLYTIYKVELAICFDICCKFLDKMLAVSSFLEKQPKKRVVGPIVIDPTTSKKVYLEPNQTSAIRLLC